MLGLQVRKCNCMTHSIKIEALSDASGDTFLNKRLKPAVAHEPHALMLLRQVSRHQMHSPMHDDISEQACRRSITNHKGEWWCATCFGRSVCSILWCRHAISSGTIHVEDVAARGLFLHDLHGCPCAQQCANHVGAYHLLQLLWRGVNEGLQQRLLRCVPG